MIELLEENPLLLLFCVAAAGYLIGRIRVGGFSLGVAAVLFVGLAASAFDARLRLPEIVFQFGLAIFVYTIGLSSGPGFFRSFGRRGLRDNAFALLVLGGISLVTGFVHLLLGLGAARTAGLYAGALTNTPALAGVVETLRERGASEALLAEPVVAYSLAYPIGVLAPITAIWLLQRLWRVDYERERADSRDAGLDQLTNLTVQITHAAGATAADLRERMGPHVLFGRRKRGETVSVVTDEMRFDAGDLVTLVGAEEDVRAAAQVLGVPSGERIELDRRVLDFRRIFVSNPEVVGKPLGTLQLPRRFGAIVSRLRRGDVELLPDANTVLEPGDRVRVLAPRVRMDEVTRFFGDSYKRLSEIDVITFSLGIALGLLVGSIPLPLPGGASFKLGAAGGPLLVGLLLGRLGRTGGLVWSMPFSANLTVRQLGLVLFLAGIGTRAGDSFGRTFREGGGLALIAVGAILTLASTLAILVVGYKLLRIRMGVLVGMVAGIHTQPAVLAFGHDQAKSDLPNLGYATVFPIATIGKIVLAQLLLVLLR